MICIAKDSIEKIENFDENNMLELEVFNKRIKEEIMNTPLEKMEKKEKNQSNLTEFIGFIETDEDTDCMKDHDLIP